MSSPSQICITGTGVVSPAGWGKPGFLSALQSGQLPEETSGPESFFAPAAPPEIRQHFRHARLRRSTRLAQLMVGAAFEALGDRFETLCKDEEARHRLQIIVSLYNGNVLYTARFFSEVLDDPSIASPILFPETVFNAPAGHLAAVLGCDADHTSLVGDGANLHQALALAANRLHDGLTDSVLLIAAEEEHPLVRSAVNLFDCRANVSEGAGALLLERRENAQPGSIVVEEISDPAMYRAHGARGVRAAINSVHNQMARGKDDTHALYAGQMTGFLRLAAAEATSFRDWPGAELAFSPIFGWSPGASAAWQFVAAVERLRADESLRSALIVSAGDTQQVIASRLAKV